MQKVGDYPDGVVSEGIAEKLTCVARSQQRADLGQECPREGEKASAESLSQKGA